MTNPITSPVARLATAAVAAIGLVGGAVALSAAASGGAQAAVPASYYCRTTPAWSHVLVTQFLNPHLIGRSGTTVVGNRSTPILNRTHSPMTGTVTATSTSSVAISTGLAVQVDMGAILASVKTTVSLNLTATTSMGVSSAVSVTAQPGEVAYSQMEVNSYAFSGTMRQVDASCGGVVWSQARTVTVPSQVTAVGHSYRV